MEPLFMCWSFDKRWLCGLPNPCHEFLLITPFSINIATIVAIIMERNNHIIEVQPKILTLISIYGLLSLLCLFLLIRTYLIAQSKVQDVRQNNEVIRQFTHQFLIKKGIWSWIGLLITLLSVAQIILNNIYITSNNFNYQCLANKVRFWVDIGSFGYIGLVILTFLVCKLCFLCISWKNPQKYLQHREVI